MEIIFQFFKERNFSELIQDFIALIRQIFKHYFNNIFVLSLPFIGFLVVSVFLLTSQIENPNNSFFGIALIIISALMMMILMGLIIGISFEYMFLLRDKQSLNFNYKDILKSFRANFLVYLKGFIGIIIVCLIIMVPFMIVYFILAFIPLIGGIIGQFMSILLSIFLSCAFLLYRDKKFGLVDSFKNTFNFIKTNWLNHGLALFLFQFILSIITLIIFFVPIAAILLFQYNTLALNEEFFLSYWGKVLIAIFAGLSLLAFIIMQIINTSFTFLIYCSNYETYFKENTFENIQQIGKNLNEN